MRARYVGVDVCGYAVAGMADDALHDERIHTSLPAHGDKVVAQAVRRDVAVVAETQGHGFALALRKFKRIW